MRFRRSLVRETSVDYTAGCARTGLRAPSLRVLESGGSGLDLSPPPGASVVPARRVLLGRGRPQRWAGPRTSTILPTAGGPTTVGGARRQPSGPPVLATWPSANAARSAAWVSGRVTPGRCRQCQTLPPSTAAPACYNCCSRCTSVETSGARPDDSTDFTATDILRAGRPGDSWRALRGIV